MNPRHRRDLRSRLAAVDAYNRAQAARAAAQPVAPAASRPGLGDMVAGGLAALGITQGRVQAIANAVGIKDCGCKKRQEALNAAGAKYLGMPPGDDKK